MPLICATQKRYHVIAPILAGKCTLAEQVESLNLGYSTVTRWLRELREKKRNELTS
jgi:cell division inhibitor SulA